MRDHTWTVAEAKTKLSEILRLASEEGPQRIGARTPYIVIPETLWQEYSNKRQPAGQWLIKQLAQQTDLEGAALELPDRKETSNRDIPFSGEEA